jgi:hypothetical protein
MTTEQTSEQVRDRTAQLMTRRRVLKQLGLLLGLASAPSLLAACAPVPSAPTTAPARPTAVPPPAAPAVAAPKPAAPVTTAPGGSVATINVVTRDYSFELDRLSVPAGPIHFTMKNEGRMTHDLWVFESQDLSAYLAKKRAGEQVKGRDYLKDATEIFDLEAGKSGEADITLKPGLLQIACFVQGQNPDGSTYVHYDKGQQLTMEVTGPGAISLMEKPAKAMNVVADEWRFQTDTLLVTAGEVTFGFKNIGKMEHDFWVFPLQDRSEYLYRKLKGEQVKGRDFLKGADELFEAEPGDSGTKTMVLTRGLWGAACFILGRNEDGSPFIHSDKGQMFTFRAV